MRLQVHSTFWIGIFFYSLIYSNRVANSSRSRAHETGQITIKKSQMMGGLFILELDDTNLAMAIT